MSILGKTIEALYEAGEFSACFNHLYKLWKSKLLPPEFNILLIRTLRQSVIEELCEPVDAILIELLNDDAVDLEPASSWLGQWFCSAYPIDLSSDEVRAQTFTNPLLLLALKKIVFVSKELENGLTRSRDYILFDFVNKGGIQRGYLPFCNSLCLQLIKNEYVYHAPKQVLDIVSELKKMLQEQGKHANWKPKDSEGVLVLLSLYGPLFETLKHLNIEIGGLDDWPSSLREIVKVDVFERAEELRLMASIDSITEVTDRVSQSVRSQYEENPYPRWENLPAQKMTSARQYLQNSIPGYGVAERFSDSVNILVAGSGTGRQPLSVAMCMENATITAVDLSKSSLAYGMRKARELGINNVRFLHGDILNLDAINESFDIIFCSGVLHHMEDPLKGWQVLSDLLAEDGLMNISLYSAIARHSIRENREYIKQLGLDSSETSIRAFRSALLNRNAQSDISMFRDFWVLSECRDLLFHEKEHQYTWLGIKESCEELGLTFLGAHNNPLVYKPFSEMFKGENDHKNLDHWHEFELKFPNAFRAMYNFWLAKKETS